MRSAWASVAYMLLTSLLVRASDISVLFQRWYSGKLPIGGEDDFRVFVGQPGAGASTFWAFQEHFLPESEGVKATLIYRDSEDKERRVTCLLKERC